MNTTRVIANTDKDNIAISMRSGTERVLSKRWCVMFVYQMLNLFLSSFPGVGLRRILNCLDFRLTPKTQAVTSKPKLSMDP